MVFGRPSCGRTHFVSVAIFSIESTDNHSPEFYLIRRPPSSRAF